MGEDWQKVLGEGLIVSVMKTINVFLDTSIVNRILDINCDKPDQREYEEDREYLPKIIENYVRKDVVQFFVNPSVKQEIEETSNLQRKMELLALSSQFHFTPFNKTVFPFVFPATFVIEEEKRMLEELRTNIKGFGKDAKIFIDAVANSQVEVLLTTDREHLACIKLHDYLTVKGLGVEIKIFTPKEFFEHLQSNIP
ncbi:MAG: hypothetical protein HY662_03820 [Chloroflexi bacterium]|nr:hypothetical protein [Chloroflexota bacterium]